MSVQADQRAVFDDFVGFVGDDRLTVVDGAEGAHVVLSMDRPGPAGSYTIDQSRRSIDVHAGDVLGLQYGLTAVLEAAGYGFLHPQVTVVPDDIPSIGDLSVASGPIAPQTARRGLHLHTLHPIEGYFDFWEPSDDHADRARRTLDWIVKSGGNYVQYPALDEPFRFPGLAPGWQEHTGALVSYAHSRGMTYGLGVQLFGSGNLQQAFDLVDGDELDEEQLRERLQLLAPLELDTLSLSFGEFSGEAPERFVSTANLAVERVREELPTVDDVVTTIHVGNYDDLRIEYQGEELLYYFLADEIDDTVPWIHSVMYYNLYEDAGGAYLHEEFDEHRTFLEEHLERGDAVGYHPESAYWVAFDNSVPTYLPLYLRSRFTDLDELRSAGLSLQDHVTFSSGWEWGYWQTDHAILRWNHTLPATWEETVVAQWKPFGPDGGAASDAVIALADLQHEKLLVDRLAAWMAGRDAIIDFGDATLGILSQPDRPLPNEIVAMDDGGLSDLDGVITGLREMADGTEAIGRGIDGVRDGDPFFDELRDGVEIDVHRARFAAAVLSASVAFARDESPEAAFDEAAEHFAAAEAVVARRRAAFHYPDREELVNPTRATAGLYDYGYLTRADELCFWQRELGLARAATGGPLTDTPPCN